MFEEGNRRSIFSRGEQTKLLSLRDDQVRRVKDAVGKQIDRINRAGCGLVLDVVPQAPGTALAVFYLSRSPQNRIVGQINGNILHVRRQDCATPLEYQSVLKWIVRSLTLGNSDEFDQLPATGSPGADGRMSRPVDARSEPGTGLVPVSRPTDAGNPGFVREIDLD